MVFDLKALRERKGLSQASLAEELNKRWEILHPDESNKFSAEAIAKMEKDPSKITLDTLLLIAQEFGLTFEQLMGSTVKKAQPLDVNNNWQRIIKLKDNFDAYIKQHAPTLAPVMFRQKLDELRKIIDRTTRKSKLVFVGSPDAGKSTLINNFLGLNILPTSWTPTTAALIILKHRSDKPAHVGNEDVWVFKDSGDFDPDGILSEEYCSKWLIAKGSYELLKRYGAHNEDSDIEEIGAIIVYADRPALLNCDLIDLPGFNPEAVLQKGENARCNDTYDSRDSMLSARAIQVADGFIYLSIANRFLYGDDLAMVQSIVKSLPVLEKKGENEIPPLGNLFVVASQAYTVNHGNADDLDLIHTKAAERLWKLVGTHPAITNRAEKHGTGYEYSVDTLKERFFAAEMDSDDLTKCFRDNLTTFIEQLPIIQEKRIWQELHAFCTAEKTFFTDKIMQYALLLEDHETMSARFQEFEKNESRRAADFRKETYVVTDTINKMKGDSARQCAKIYSSIISSDHIKELIEKHGYKKNKRDLQELIAVLNSELENELTSVLAQKSKELKSVIDKFITGVSISCKDINSDASVSGNISIAFNAGRAFAGGLSGLATYGALAAWAASCGNLGGYILVAKAVSLLASIGINLGGTAAVISAVSSIGGPVTLGITIAILAALTAILALGGTWKKLIGNKLVKEYEKKNVLDELIKVSDKFWDDTMSAFRQGVESVESDWQNHMADYREKLENFDSEKIENEISEMQQMVCFFDSLCNLDEAHTPLSLQ